MRTRSSNTFGPYQYPTSQYAAVVPRFIHAIAHGEPVTIYGDGRQTRSFCYVDDLVGGLVRLMGSSDGFTGPVNLGNPAEFSMKDLAELVIELTGSRSKLSYLPLPQDDPRQRQPDISLADTELDWQPTVPLREGLRHTIAYFDRLLSTRPNGKANELSALSRASDELPLKSA